MVAISDEASLSFESVQELLYNLDYFAGPIDGKPSPEFQTALRYWIRSGCTELVNEIYGQDLPGLPSR